MATELEKPEDLLRAYLTRLGAAAGDPRLLDTPRLVTGVLARFLEARPEPELTLFPAEGPGVVSLRGLRFYSLCEHHLLPFFGRIHVAYAPAAHVAGFGGIERCIAHLATRLQLQERLTAQIADLLELQLRPHGLAVVSQARQLCLEMTGGSPEASIGVTVCRGRFTEADARAILGGGT